MEKNKVLIVVVGPTAIGKTSKAIELARDFNCEIISCDSRQFYKEMSIGTAVPTRNELEAVRHHFIHHKSIFEEYTVGDFEKDAIAKLDELYEVNDFALLVGGSGLYVNAVLHGFDEFPQIDPSVRKQLAEQFEKDGIGFLQTELKAADPEYFKIVDTENPQRMMRALEVSLGSGRPYSSFLSGRQNERRFTPIVVGLDAGREIVYDRINRRVDSMMDEGLLAEAEKLYRYQDLNALQTVGYRELFDYLAGKTELDFAVSEIKKNTRRFAKRQMTWFRRDEKTEWFDYLVSKDVISNHIRETNHDFR